MRTILQDESRHSGSPPMQGHVWRTACAQWKRAQVNSAGEYTVADHQGTYPTAVQPPLIVTFRAP